MWQKIHDSLEKINKYQSDIKSLIEKHYYIEDQMKQLTITKDVCDTLGSSKGLIESFKATNPEMIQVFENKGKQHLLNVENYDHFSFKNEINEELKETLFNLHEVLNNISQLILQEVGEQVNDCHRTCNDYTLLIKDYMTRTRMELSNTSREVIPAKARECSFTCYPIKDNKFDISSDKQALTLDELNLTTDKVIGLIDEILGSVSPVNLKYDELEKKYYKDITEKLTQFNKNKILVLEGMKLIKHFQTCY
jgi:hypothetical protein